MPRKKIVIPLLFFIACFNQNCSGYGLSYEGFYSSPQEIISKLEASSKSHKEHFMLGLSYNDIGEKKKALYHFANSAFKFQRSNELKLYPQPVYSFLNGYHFKSAYYNDAVYEIACIFFDYGEFEYIPKLVNLINKNYGVLYRDAVLLKAKALTEMNNKDTALNVLTGILTDFTDNDSNSIILIRIASIYEKKEDFQNAVKFYLKIISIDPASWHSEIACSRILDITKDHNFIFDSAEKTVLCRSLYINKKYKECLNISRGISHEYFIKSSVRSKKVKEADALIKSLLNDKKQYYKALLIKADELFDIKQESALNLYKQLLNCGESEIEEKSLRNICIHYAKKNQASEYIKQYINKYPANKETEFFMWILSQQYIDRNDTAKAVAVMQKAVSDFPHGKYSDWFRFWLYKSAGQNPEQYRNDLIIYNFDSGYAWTILNRIISEYSKDDLEKQFDSAVNAKNVSSLYFHRLLFYIEKDFSRRDKRIRQMDYIKDIKKYSIADNDKIEEISAYKKFYRLLDDIEKYFEIGYIEGINRDLNLIPADSEMQKAKSITLARYGEAYNNYHLSLTATSKLLKLNNLKEDISLLPVKAVKRLYPDAYKNIITDTIQNTGISPGTVFAVIKTESSFNHKAVSPAGAVGLMQIMPRTGKGIAKNFKLENYDLKNPAISILFGLNYLKWLSNMFAGDFDNISAAYNGGAANVKKWKKKNGYHDKDLFIEKIPYNETRNYVIKTRKYQLQYSLLLACDDIY